MTHVGNLVLFKMDIPNFSCHYKFSFATYDGILFQANSIRHGIKSLLGTGYLNKIMVCNN